MARMEVGKKKVSNFTNAVLNRVRQAGGKQCGGRLRCCAVLVILRFKKIARALGGESES